MQGSVKTAAIPKLIESGVFESVYRRSEAVGNEMKLLFMGSIPTFRRDEEREVSPQEEPLTRACRDMGLEAARCRHTILVADGHPAFVDRYVAAGASQFASTHPDKEVFIEVNRPEGQPLVFQDLASNVSVKHIYHAELDRSEHGTGTLIPNLAALDSSNVLIVAGGRLTARLMGNIAADREKSVLAIPTFGGTAAELYERLKYLYKNVMRDRLDDLAALQSVWMPDSGERIIRLAEALAADESDAPAHSYFISYTWKDSELADHVEVLLQRSNRPVNRDESMFRAGVDLSDIVKSLIQQSDTFVGIWNQRFKDSSWCPSELEYALNRQVKGLKPTRVVLITADDTETPIRFTGKLRLAGRDRDQRDLSVRKLIEEEAP